MRRPIALIALIINAVNRKISVVPFAHLRDNASTIPRAHSVLDSTALPRPRVDRFVSPVVNVNPIQILAKHASVLFVRNPSRVVEAVAGTIGAPRAVPSVRGRPNAIHTTRTKSGWLPLLWKSNNSGRTIC